jgi:CIC family chloride channel protein
MIANLVSFVIARGLQPLSISQALAMQDGIHLPGEEVRKQFAKRNVAQIMRPPTEVLSGELTLQQAFEQTRSGTLEAWLVLDQQNLGGIVRRAALERAIAMGKGARRLMDLAGAEGFPHVHADHPLDIALERMGIAKLDILPVVSRADIRLVLGTVALPDILNSFGVGGTDADNPLVPDDDPSSGAS